MLLLCQRSEEYNQFMLAKMADAVAPAILGANRENAFRCCMGAQQHPCQIQLKPRRARPDIITGVTRAGSRLHVQHVLPSL